MHIAILDDYQGVALSVADWAPLQALATEFPPPGQPTIEALLRPVGEHWIPDAYAADDLLV